MALSNLTQEILDNCLPEALITDEDRSTIAEHADYLLSLEDALVATFYDTLYAHPTTAKVFVDGERPDREETLRDWWRKTVRGGLDDKYLEWMTLVGIIHIRRKVQNPMMITMFQIVTALVNEESSKALGPETGSRIARAFSHLQATVSSIISEAYTKGYIGALENLAGLDPKLTERMLAIEVKALEEEGRAGLA